MEVQLKLWKSNKCATLPTCNSLLQVPFLFWLLEGAGAKISKLLVLVYVFDAMVSILLALGFGRALLFHYCTHEGRSQHSVADTRVNCSILVTTCPWKICPYNANMQRPFFFKRTFFCWGPSGRRPKVRKNASKVRKYPSGLDPSEPKGFFSKKRTFFFYVRPSIRQNCFSSWHQKIRASGCAQTPCLFSHKCRNVQMFAPAAHYQKQAKVLYFDTNCGSKAFQPWSFSYAPGSEWCVRVPDPTLHRTRTKRSHDLA